MANCKQGITMPEPDSSRCCMFESGPAGYWNSDRGVLSLDVRAIRGWLAGEVIWEMSANVEG